MRRLVLLPLLASLWAPPGGAQPYLVKDINPSFDEQSSAPNLFAHFGRYAIFVASTLQEGSELRSSDGTAAGTFLLADACPGACSSNPAPIAVTPRGVFFATATLGGDSSNLWITRGTPATTALLAEGVRAGGGRGAVWMESQGVLYFSGSDSTHGPELWRSDGTPAGTYLVKDIWPGPAGAVSELEPTAAASSSAPPIMSPAWPCGRATARRPARARQGAVAEHSPEPAGAPLAAGHHRLPLLRGHRSGGPRALAQRRHPPGRAWWPTSRPAPARPTSPMSSPSATASSWRRRWGTRGKRSG